MKKVIISGVNGFIGSSLCNKFLEEGYKVIGIGKKDSKRRNTIKSNNFIYMDINDLDSNILDSAEIFFHLAWDTGFYNVKGNLLSSNVELENIKMSYNIADKIIKSRVKKIVFIGSISQEMYYFDSNRELTNIKGRIYGIAKQTASHMIKKLSFDANVEFNEVLLANTYGPNDYNMKSVSQFIKKMVKNEKIDLIEENDLTDWMYIDDTVAGLITIGEKGKNMKTYYLGHRKILKFKDYITQLKKVLNSNSELRFGVYTELLGYDYSKVDLDALYNDTGFECSSDFQKSILQTAKWLDEKGFIDK